jgi:oligopeptide/dipeptide ABC transporter ATP-binding protein
VKHANHPYSAGLMASIPPLDRRVERLAQIDGAMPRLSAIPQGCAYNPRCPTVFGKCRELRPTCSMRAPRAPPAGCTTRRPPWLSDRPMIEVRDLARHFDVSRPLLQRMVAREGRRTLRAVDGISFADSQGHDAVAGGGVRLRQVHRRAALRVGSMTPTAGAVVFDGRDLAEARAMADQRRRMQMIFQDPYASLNPRWRVGDIIAEPIRAFGLIGSLARGAGQPRRGTADAGRALAARSG